MARAANPWAYRVDYDKEVAVDLKEIAQAERHVPLAQVLTEAERALTWELDLMQFLFSDVERRASLLGLTPDDVADLWWYHDLDPSGFEYDAPEPKKGWYGRGEKLCVRLTEQYDIHVIRDPQARLKYLRARLSRHRRHKVKFG